MLFNVDKSKVMHIGKNNPFVRYSLCGKTLDYVIMWMKKVTWGHYE